MTEINNPSDRYWNPILETLPLEKFLADKSPDKRAVLVRSLLGDDIGYAEHWLTFWNDLLRFFRVS